MTEVEVHLTVFVRLPSERSDFLDPPPASIAMSYYVKGSRSSSDVLEPSFRFEF